MPTPINLGNNKYWVSEGGSDIPSSGNTFEYGSGPNPDMFGGSGGSSNNAVGLTDPGVQTWVDKRKRSQGELIGLGWSPEQMKNYLGTDYDPAYAPSPKPPAAAVSPMVGTPPNPYGFAAVHPSMYGGSPGPATAPTTGPTYNPPNPTPGVKIMPEFTSFGDIDFFKGKSSGDLSGVDSSIFSDPGARSAFEGFQGNVAGQGQTFLDFLNKDPNTLNQFKSAVTGEPLTTPTNPTQQPGAIKPPGFRPPTTPTDITGFGTPNIPTTPIPSHQPNILGFEAAQVVNPELAPGTEATFKPLEEKPGESIDPATGILGSVPTSAAVSADPNQISKTDIDTITMPTASIAAVANANAHLISDVATVQASLADAAQGTVTPESLVRTQLSFYMDDVASGNAPWADEAARTATAKMLERGLGASSMAGAAITQAILEAATPLAQFDASVFGALNIENLRNRQQTMLSNQAATNAAKHFNATAINQTNIANQAAATQTELANQTATNQAAQFNAAQSNDVKKFMSNLKNGLMKFNVEQKNAMDKFNTEQENASNQFYDKMLNEAEKFNAQNSLLIAKSNAEWRRSINTANTAAENASIMQNTQNRFNISQQALANIWQRSRDVFHWANQAAQNDKDRALKLALYSMERAAHISDMDREEKNNLFSGIGGIAWELFKPVASSWVNTTFDLNKAALTTEAGG